jgi:putative ABC transport system permease protein
VLRITLKGLIARKLRLLLTAISITIGVAGVAGAFIFTDSVDSAFRGIFQQANAGIDVSITRRGAASAGEAGTRGVFTNPNATRFDVELLDEVRNVPGVRYAEGTVFGSAQLYDPSGEPIGGQGPPTLGFSWPVQKELTPFRLSKGGPPAGPSDVAIDESAAKQGKVKINDWIRISFEGGAQASRYRVVGFVRFGPSSATQGVTYALFDLATAQRVFEAQGRFDAIGVQGYPGVSQRELARRVQEVLPTNLVARTGEEQTADDLKEVERGIGFLRTAMLGIAIVTLFVGAFVIFNTFSIIVAQRTREFGLLRAVGATRRQVLATVVLEGATVGLIGSIVGIAGGVGIARLVRSVFERFDLSLPQSGMELQPRTIGICLIVGVGVTVLAALAPAIRSSRVSAMEALREGQSGPVRTARIGSLVGALIALTGGGLIAWFIIGATGGFESRLAGIGSGFALLIIGVAMIAPLFVRPVLLVLGLPLRLFATGRIAVINAGRSPRRTAATAAALMIGIGLASFMAIFTESAAQSIERQIDRTIGADLILSNAARGTNLPPKLVGIVSKAPGVAEAVPVRTTPIEARVGTDSAWNDSFVDAVPAAQRRIARTLEMTAGSDRIGTRRVLLSDTEARTRGIDVGERIQLRSPQGTATTFTVGGIYRAAGVADYLMSERDHNAVYPAAARVPAVILVNATPDYDIADLRASLTRALVIDGPFVQVQDQSELKQEVRDQLDQLFGLLIALLVLALFIALIGIINTLALSVYERTREIGLLRAVGMTRGQARRMVRFEAVLISLIGAALGLVLGVGLGAAVAQALASEGLELAIPITFVAQLVVAGIIAGIAASILPARRAARLDVLTAIAHE